MVVASGALGLAPAGGCVSVPLSVPRSQSPLRRPLVQPVRNGARHALSGLRRGFRVIQLSKPNLRVIDPNHEHPRDVARRRVKDYRKPKEPITNIHVPEDVRPSKHLVVDEVLERSYPNLIGKK